MFSNTKANVYAPSSSIVQPSSTLSFSSTGSSLPPPHAASDAAIRGGLLHHTLTTKPTPVAVPVQHKETTCDSIIYREREVPVPVPVVQEVEKPLTPWQQLRLHLANIMLILLAIAAAVWALKKRAS